MSLEMKFTPTESLPPKYLGSDKGYVLDQWDLVNEDGEVIAYLKTTYISRENWDQINKSIYHFAVAFCGWCVKGGMDAMAKATTPVEIYELLSSRIDGWGTPKLENPTEEEVLERFRKFEDGYEFANFLYQYLEYEDYFVDKPYIDYSRILEAENKRKGYATALYKKAALYYAGKGMKLRASTCQSPDSKALWESFERKGWVTEGEDLAESYSWLKMEGKTRYLDPSKF